ncbi:methyl-accepting chemotaxis protein, partial [Aliarcobacter lanthieri]|uniref:methyl-accepting chemotaxis protein n=1 Tax=Aliarcobacter lanthieri TaxID=1355374 RepID=UPI001D177A08
GLLGFFAYLNREVYNIELLKDSSKDEFGEMAKVVNENIKKTQKGIEEDRRLIDETITVLSEFEQGDLCQRLNIEVTNPALMQLKQMLNNMGENLESNINNILNILEQYANYNYLNKIDQKGLKEHLLKLARGVNHLGDSITTMLVENKSNGLTLENSSKILLSNVDILNVSSNEAATSLEETAATLEEITSNIRNTTHNIAKMSNLSTDVTKSVNEGEELANKTTTAMDEINAQVNAISEAIGVIDNIAFQTNILSLNAAVEAATAGESGKGFAVVAQEVRNLASRSAEAAKEIKDIVERATVKADEGKQIATNMINGYVGLSKNIEETITLISDIEMSSKEQLMGIEQINDAVNQLDQQTQQNAMVASQTNDIAIQTNNIAKLVVSNANEKEFIGKNDVCAKTFDSNENDTLPIKEIA